MATALKPHKAPKQHKCPGHLFITASSDQVTLEAAEASGDKKLRRYKMCAYNGGLLQVSGWYYPVVVDLAGLSVAKQSRPNFLNHDPNQIVGHTESIDVGTSRITAKGVISGAGEAARQVVESADNGFPWQASIGVQVLKALFVEEKTTAKANGKEFAGPCYIARKSSLFESSFVPLGADDSSSVTVNAAAAAKYPSLEAQTMTFEQWLEAMGLTLAGLSDEQQTKLRAKFDAEQKDQADPEDPAKPPVVKGGKGDEGEPVDPLQAQREKHAAEIERVAKIQEIAANYQTCMLPADMAKLQAEAVRGKWSPDAFELAAMRADRAKAPAVGSGRGATNAQTIEAALCQAAGVKEPVLLKSYGEKVLEAAQSLKGLGLKRTIEICAGLEGKPIPLAFGRDTIRAGFSTVSLPGVLSNMANKILLDQFLSVDPVSTRIAGRRNVNDFKAVTSYQLTMNGELQEVGPGGELKSISLSEGSRTNQAKNRGMYMALTYEMIMNDDLGAFEQILRGMARLCAIGREKVVFKVHLGNAGNFFHANHKNLLSGASSALSIKALGSAEKLMMQQVDTAGNPVQINPAILLVPPALKGDAEDIYFYRSTNETTSADSRKPNGNRFAGRFRVECSPFMASNMMTGADDDAWYLLADPNDVPVVELAYLNGQDTPTIEQGEVAFDRLGMAWRAIYDFGAAQAEYRAGIKSNGK